MVAAMDRLGVRARLLVLWPGKPEAHNAVEVWFRRGWHFFDPLYGGYFRDATGNVCSWADIEAGKAERMIEWERTLDVVNEAGILATNHGKGL